MAEKKRKVNGSGVEQPLKKSKRSSSQPSDQTSTVSDLVQLLSSSSNDQGPLKSKKTRKRASDFLSDEDDEVATVKKSKKHTSKNKIANLLSADGVNGLLEHSSDEGGTLATNRKDAKTSMIAEAERTADEEFEDEFGGVDLEQDDEEIDHAPALLAGFDSDTEDVAEDKELDTSRTAPIPQFKKTNKKLRQAAAQPNDGPGAVYVGRIPHGFYEAQMREYFSQFGTITRLRLSRNKRTGASKHFAFIEFESEEVAKIVAEAMDNYLMFGHILKCKFAPAESLHPDVWKGANKKFRKIPHQKLIRQKEDAPKTQAQWENKIRKETKKRQRKAEQLKQIGYDFQMPQLTRPAEVLAQKQLESTEEPPKAIEAPVAEVTVPKPEVVEGSNQNKKEKRVKKTTSKNGASITEIQEVEIKEPPKKVAIANGDVKASKKKGKAGKTEEISESTSIVAVPGKEKQLKSILKKPKKA